MRALLTKVVPGGELIPLVRYMTQEKVERFAVAACNSGTAHLDRAYCFDRFPQKKPYGFGFMLIGYFSEMMDNNFGEAWAKTGTLDVKFIASIFAGQSYVVSGGIRSMEKDGDGYLVCCSLKTTIHDGTLAAVAEATVRIGLDLVS